MISLILATMSTYDGDVISPFSFVVISNFLTIEKLTKNHISIYKFANFLIGTKDGF